MTFSDRFGFTLPTIQIDGMSDALRNSIWNFITEPMNFEHEVGKWPMLLNALASTFFKVPVEEAPTSGGTRGRKWLRNHYKRLEWYEVYNLLEFTVEHAGFFTLGNSNREKQTLVANNMLERELSGYRLVNSELTPITNKMELRSIEKALSASKDACLDGVRTHLKTALALFSQKPNPDFRNSIKESISAVESAAKLISGVSSGGLDAALETLEKQIQMHGALKKGFLSLYGYTSNADGIRHALLEEPNAGFDEAKFMLVACSAFTNYLISKVKE